MRAATRRMKKVGTGATAPPRPRAAAPPRTFLTVAGLMPRGSGEAGTAVAAAGRVREQSGAHGRLRIIMVASERQRFVVGGQRAEGRGASDVAVIIIINKSLAIMV